MPMHVEIPPIESRTRLLFVLTSGVRGGIEEVALSLIRHLDRRLFVVGFAAPKGLLAAVKTDLEDIEVETAAVSAHSWLAPGQVFRLAAILRRFRPDVVNPHLFRSTLVAAPLARLMGVPRVVETYHGREAWRRGLFKGSFVVDRLTTRFVDRVVAVSVAARDFLVEAKRIPEKKVIVVPNGRDLSFFRPGRGGAGVRQELGLGPDQPVLGIVGRLEAQKGHSVALKALRKIADTRPDVRLLVVGDGSLRESLGQLTAELGLGDHVLFLGYRADVPAVLDAADVIVLPSFYEGMPLSAIEAAAMAKPIVATAVDGTSEVVEDGVTGRLVPPGDAEALGDAILPLLGQPELGASFGRAGRQRALERFDLSVQVARMTRVYKEDQ
jgi:glycosyltransferase involved in cell wall biosynthesis